MAKYNQSFFQIPATGLSDVWAGASNVQTRAITMRMSNFGDLNYGPRCSVDYTRTAHGFKNKDELQNPTVPSFAMEAEYNENPFVWGSTVKRMRHDELRIMTLGSRFMDGAGKPRLDVMDTKLSHSTPKDGDMVLNWPSEGYKPFGGRTGGPFGYRVSK